MLLKQFLNDKEILYLLKIAKNIDYKKKANGVNVFIEKIIKFKNDKILKCIINKALTKLNEHYIGFEFHFECSVFLKIENKGWVSKHLDWVEFNKRVLNFNILLQKPKDGGFILHGNKKIIMNVGDAYILDASIPHGISSLKSDDNYFSLIFWNSKNIK